VTPMLVMIIVAVGLTLLGFAGLRRRDLPVG
jgi:putative exporter of polyketide antibiotics